MNANVTHSGSPVGYVDIAAFKSAMRNVAGGVSIVATGSAAERRGLTVTSACSVSVDPPCVLICINRSADAHDFIANNGTFSWNVLSAAQAELAERFAARDGSKGAARFSSPDWYERITGAPILGAALSSFDCRVVHAFDLGTHTVFIGAVVAEAHQSAGEPLVYVRGRFAVPRDDACATP
jgi:flavin reductase (DIM6/NTAB) family NADH-FMN oxidoreductase RutF